MGKKPLVGILAVIVLAVAGYIVYSQMNKAQHIVDMFDNHAEASYSQIIQWSEQFSSIETAKSKTKSAIMIPSDTLGNKLKTIYVRKGMGAVSRSYIMVYEGFRLEAITNAGSVVQTASNARSAIAQFSNQVTNVKVHGAEGFAAEKNETTVNGIQYKIPTTIAWWENNTTYLAIAKDMSVDDLLKICNSAKLQ